MGSNDNDNNVMKLSFHTCQQEGLNNNNNINSNGNNNYRTGDSSISRSIMDF